MNNCLSSEFYSACQDSFELKLNNGDIEDITMLNDEAPYFDFKFKVITQCKKHRFDITFNLKNAFSDLYQSIIQHSVAIHSGCWNLNNVILFWGFKILPLNSTFLKILPPQITNQIHTFEKLCQKEQLDNADELLLNLIRIIKLTPIQIILKNSNNVDTTNLHVEFAVPIQDNNNEFENSIKKMCSNINQVAVHNEDCLVCKIEDMGPLDTRVNTNKDNYIIANSMMTQKTPNSIFVFEGDIPTGVNKGKSIKWIFSLMNIYQKK